MGLTKTGNEINIGTASSSRISVASDSIDLATVNQTNTSGANTVSFISSHTIDSYGRVTGTETSSVSFSGYATLDGPTFTGVPTAPTAANGVSNTQLATTQFVANAATIAYNNAVTDAGTSASSAYIPKSLADAKGDLIVGTADNTFGRLAVGTNGQVIRANSSTTSGLEWFALTEVVALNDLSDVTSVSPTSGDFLKWNSTAWVNDAINLGTDTIGNYMADVSAGTGISITHTPSEGSTATIGINTLVVADLTTAQNMSNKTLDSAILTNQATTTSTTFNLLNTTMTTLNFAGSATSIAIGNASGNTTMYGNVTIGGNFLVNGTNTIINANTLVISDKNIEMGNAETPTNTTADGGGIILKGTTDKTITWSNAISSWTSSEDLNLVTGKVYEINGTSVLSGTTLGSGVTGSSLTSFGTSPALTTPVISSGGATFNGSTSGTTILRANATAGSTTITMPAVTGTIITTGDTGTVTSSMIANGTIANEDISSSASIDQNKIADTVLNQQTTSYTLALTDKNKMVEISNASATTLTIAADNTVNFSVGATIIILQTGSGQITLTEGSGVTINATPGKKLRAQWSSATLVKRSANTWVALGDLVL